MIIFKVLDTSPSEEAPWMKYVRGECTKNEMNNNKMCNCKDNKNCNYTNKLTVPTIAKVTFNGPATVVKWSDGTITRSVCHKDDKCDYQIGLALAISKKYLKLTGVKSFDKFYTKYTEDKNNYVIKNKAVKK